MILWVVETIHANGSVLFDHAHLCFGDAVREAYEFFDAGDVCCEMNDGSEDDFKGLQCQGGCKIKSPRIVEYKAERVEK